MKKKNVIIGSGVIVIIVVLITGLLAVKKNKMSISDMISNSKELSLEELFKDINENEIRATDKYKDNIYTITGFIQEFQGNNIVLSEYSNSIIRLIAELPKDELKILDKGQQVKIIGKVSNIEQKEKSSTTSGTTSTYKTYIVEMKNAYIQQDIFEYKGVVNIPDKDYILRDVNGKISWQTRKDSEWYCNIGECDMTEYGEIKKFTSKDNEKSTVAGIEIKNNDIVQMKGKIIYDNQYERKTKYKIKDIQDIKVLLESENK